MMIIMMNVIMMVVVANISAAKAVDRESGRGDIGRNPGFLWISDFFAGFWTPGGVPAARSRNSGPDELRESPR